MRLRRDKIMLDFDPLYSTSKIESINAFINEHYSLGGPVSADYFNTG